MAAARKGLGLLQKGWCALQNRYMKSAKDWGWREFITLQALFDADAGYLVNDDCIFAAEVLMLKESSEAHQVCMLKHCSCRMLQTRVWQICPCHMPTL